MRLAALAIGLALAGAANAAEAPTTVDLIVIAQVTNQTPRQIFAEQEGEFYIDPPMAWTAILQVHRQLRGRPVKGLVRISYVNKFGLRDAEPAVYWLKRKPDGSYALVCNHQWIVASRLDASADKDAGVTIGKHWRTKPCKGGLPAGNPHQG